MAFFDEVGIDVAAHVAETMSPMFNARGGKSTKKAEELVHAGFLGRKNKKGMYNYHSKKKTPNVDAYTYFGGSNRKNPNAEKAQLHIALMMINEAAYCLQENIIKSPNDGDLGAILGLGFPPFTGGPFRYLEVAGIQNVVDQMK